MAPADPLASIRNTFFEECEEQLAELETGLLALQGGDRDPETVNAVFRAVHSMKGGAGAFSMTELVRFAHVFETTLDEVRAGRLQPEARLLEIMLRAADVLADLVRAARDGGAVDEGRTGELLRELGAYTGGGDEDDAAPADDPFAAFAFDVVTVGVDGDDAPAASGPAWLVRFTPRTALYENANEPAILLRELATLGPCSVTIDEAALPAFDALEPEKSYLGWTIRVETAADEATIREVFDFVESDCDLVITPDGAAEPEPVFAPEPEPVFAVPVPIPEATNAAPAGDELDIQALIRRAQGAAAAPQPAPAVSAPEPVPASRPAPEPSHPGPAASERGDGAPAPAAAQTIRVDLERVDRLINLVGELVINQAMLTQRFAENGLAKSSGIGVGLDDLETLTRDIQDSVMAIRAQPVKSVFQRMPRLVRELAAMTGKQVRLAVEGENTEVDKTVIERLSDPITHMIRNAVDHGLESTEDRIAAGKPAEGTVRLAALHRSGRIVIEVGDDGGGINRKRVRAIAVEKALIQPDENLTDDEIDNLIFMPGFSTAATISDISGRGVGMDVVRRSIQALGGRISITSRPGLGSTFTLSLPLTLAVLDGMVVSVADQTLVVPLNNVMETLQPKPAELSRIEGSAPLLRLRDRYVPLIDIGQKLGYRADPVSPNEGVALLVEGEGGRGAALLVDNILGQRQVVIKSLEANYRRVDGIAAATILGDGRVALIVDVDSVLDGQHVGSQPADAPAELLLAKAG